MPRRKAVPEGMPPIPVVCPEGMSDDVWQLGRKLGNVSLAADLLDVSAGERVPSNVGETVALLDTSRKLEDGAFKRYVKLLQNERLSDAKREYDEHRDRTARLSLLVENPEALIRRNGHESPSDVGTASTPSA